MIIKIDKTIKLRKMMMKIKQVEEEMEEEDNIGDCGDDQDPPAREDKGDGKE